MTPGDFDSPPYGAATGVDFAFSPDSQEIAYLRNPDKVEATSTNSDIYLVPLAGGAGKNITVANRGYDAGPIYTRDGRFILYRSQATPAFEADRWRLMSYNRSTGVSTEILKGFDEQVEEIAPSSNGSEIYFITKGGIRYFMSDKTTLYADVGVGAATLNIGLMWKIKGGS